MIEIIKNKSFNGFLMDKDLSLNSKGLLLTILANNISSINGIKDYSTDSLEDIKDYLLELRKNHYIRFNLKDIKSCFIKNKRKEGIIMTADETLKLIAKQWCNLSDLMKLAGVGRNTALNIKSTIKKRLENENYYVPNNAVPMIEVVKYLDIDIAYLEERVNTLKGE